ncbi:MAG: flavin reductase family protein [Acidaminococcaceae bacterium]|nr:flavin reductase family protein [Acidaminococcaceae bacterium]
MQNFLFNKIVSGVYMLGTCDGNKRNACVIDSCMHVTFQPARVAISVLKTNLTAEMIQKSGVFSLSVFDRSVQIETIARFGFQSGRNADKFGGFECPLDSNGCPYLKEQVCGMLSAKVISALDMGTHLLFVGEVQNAEVFSNRSPELFTEYQRELNSQPN